MTRVWMVVALVALAACRSSSASAQFESRRTLSAAETRTVVETLLRDPTAPLSEDPSCKADLSRPGSMSVAQGLAVALLRAATDKTSVAVVVDCFVRPGYPLLPGQESCRLAFVTDQGPKAFGYGLVFVIDWGKQTIPPGTVECY